MKMNPQQAQQYLQTYFVEAQAREAKKTKEEGDKFLAENKTKEGVITTESGLQYKVEKEGTGAKPTATDKVKFIIPELYWTVLSLIAPWIVASG